VTAIGRYRGWAGAAAGVQLVEGRFKSGLESGVVRFLDWGHVSPSRLRLLSPLAAPACLNRADGSPRKICDRILARVSSTFVPLVEALGRSGV